LPLLLQDNHFKAKENSKEKEGGVRIRIIETETRKVIFANDHPLFICFGMDDQQIEEKIQSLQMEFLAKVRHEKTFGGWPVDEQKIAGWLLYGLPIYYHVHEVMQLEVRP
jgi:hypothetical protein